MKSGRFSAAGWAGSVSETGRYMQGTGVVTPLEGLTSSNPVDRGWVAARTRPGQGGNSWQVSQARVSEATVKVYGVAVVRPQG
jgi:hypothetical protein